MADQCSTCMFMRTLSDTTLHCRRYAPNSPGQGSQLYVWPQVSATEWCGDGRSATDGHAFAEPLSPTFQPQKPVTGKKS